ncbi:MAG: sporulation initiation factor Spo0A C-terminal domain-containing protein [Oscillospiraceae bacterium]|nr:sporulation initiation factor Spo0A C-terminal domain-containing protein [Oscillospiraceae bacterium]
MSKTFRLLAEIKDEQIEAFQDTIDRLCDQFEIEFNVFKYSGYSKASVDAYLTELFVKCGMPTSCKGNIYLRTIVHLALSDSAYLQRKVTSKLYPDVAALYNTKAISVEKAIRHAISATWNNGNYMYLNKTFGFTISSSTGKPTNSAFIARIVDLVKANVPKTESTCS